METFVVIYPGNPVKATVFEGCPCAEDYRPTGTQTFPTVKAAVEAMELLGMAWEVA